MSYCPNCGEKTSESSKFCGKCGNLLQEESTQKENNNFNMGVIGKNNTIQDNTNHLLEGFKTYLRIITSYGKEIGEFIEKGKSQTAYIILLISTLLQSFLYFLKVKQVYDGLFIYYKNIIIKFITTLSKLMGRSVPDLDFSELMDMQGQLSIVKSYFPLEIPKIFFQGLLLSLIVISIISIGIYVISKKNGMITILKIVGVATIPFVCGSLASILLSYLNGGLGLVVFLFAILASLGSLYINVSKYLLNGKSSVVGLSLVITVLLIILSVVVGNFVSKEIANFISKFMDIINFY